jgi:hypothetical protein
VVSAIGAFGVDPGVYQSQATRTALRRLLVAIGNLLGKLERAKGFEPSTPTLARLCSTPELHPLARHQAASRAYMAEERSECNRQMKTF